MDPQPTLGVIGLGALGEAIARRLGRAGFPLMVFDIASGPLRYFVMKNQADIALSPKMMAETCDAVITVLPSVAAVREAALGRDGLAEGARPGCTLIDMGTADVEATKSLAAELAGRGIAFVAAPVCGTPVDAKAGRLVVPVSGDAAAIDRFMPVFKALGEQVVRTGAPGSSTVLAALADYVRGASLLALGEALLIAGREGVSAVMLLDMCKSLGTLGAAVDDAVRPREVPRSLAAAHTLGMVLEDLDIALNLARAAGLEMPLAARCRERLAAARTDLGPEADHAEVIRWLESHSRAPAPEPAS